jgi:hypothetical protein
VVTRADRLSGVQPDSIFVGRILTLPEPGPGSKMRGDLPTAMRFPRRSLPVRGSSGKTTPPAGRADFIIERMNRFVMTIVDA